MIQPFASAEGTQGVRAPYKGRRSTRAIGALCLVLWSLAWRWPTVGGPNFLPDAAEYLGIARRVAQGKGLTTALKWHFFDKAPVVRPAGLERPILYPLFGAGVLWLAPHADPLQALQKANALLSVVNALVALLAFRTVVSPPAAWLGAFLMALLPPITHTATAALSETLFLFLWLLALAVLPSLFSVNPAGRGCACLNRFLFGVLAGLATLARPNGALLLLAPLALLRRRGQRRAAVLCLGWALGGALLVVAPTVALTAMPPGPGYRPAALVNFAVAHIRDASWHGYGRDLPSPWDYIPQHPREVGQGVARKLWQNARALLLSLGWLWLFLPLAWGVRHEAKGPSTLWRTWCMVAAASYLALSLSWVASGSFRYMLPVTILVLPLVLQIGLAACWRARPARLFFLAVVFGTLFVFGKEWEAHRRQCERTWESAAWETYREGASWLREVACPSDVVASNNPWIVHYLTQNPSVALPFFAKPTDLAGFVRRFGVRWILLFAKETDPRMRVCLNCAELRWVRRQGTGHGHIVLFSSAGILP